MRPWLRVAGVLVVVFLAGAVAGHAYGRVTAADASGSAWTELTAELSLTREQQARIDAVFERYQPSTDALLTGLMPRLRALTDSMHAEIEAVLTPDQRRRWEDTRPAPTFLIKRKTLDSVRVDTLRPQ